MPDKDVLSDLTQYERVGLEVEPARLDDLWRDHYAFKKKTQERWAADDAAKEEREKWEGRFWKLVALTAGLLAALAGALGTLLGILISR
ncbi:MAG: hypothetical protein V3W22_05380 [Thermoplasmata archaeon]